MGSSRPSPALAAEVAAPPPAGVIRFVPLGGLGEIGKNLALVEVGPDVVAIDLGLAFPERPDTGVDVLLPDLQFLRSRRERLRAVLLTHGHEDHIGGLPFYLEELGVPVYGTPMTLGLLRNKLRRRGYAGAADLRSVEPGERFAVGELEVELVRLTHSVPGSAALAIRSSAGLILHTGDFKLDQTPVAGPPPDLGRLARLGEEGVRLLLSDSTNALVPGLTPSERSVRPALRRALEEAPGRVTVVTFASNLARMRQTLELAQEVGRRCCLVGWSMLRNFETAIGLGYLTVPPGLLVQPRELAGIPGSGLCLLATGSQGEPLAALSRIAQGGHPFITLSPGDTVVLAANPIPGNESTVSAIVNQLVAQQVRVLSGSRDGVHASGHASREELRLVLELLRPQGFVPVHGEVRHLDAHLALARECGLGGDRALLAGNGDVVETEGRGLRLAGRVPVGAVGIDAQDNRGERAPQGVGAGGARATSAARPG